MGLFADRVQETSTTSGTGSFTMLGAVAGYQSFANAFSTGTELYYTATDGTNWEVGIGTFTSPETLARTTVTASSNGGSLVNFSGAILNIWNDVPAAFLNPIGRIVSTSGNVSMSPFDGIVEIQQSVAAAIDIVTPVNPVPFWKYTIKDGLGHASISDSMTIVPYSGTIDGASSYVITSPYGQCTFYYNGTNLRII